MELAQAIYTYKTDNSFFEVSTPPTRVVFMVPGLARCNYESKSGCIDGIFATMGRQQFLKFAEQIAQINEIVREAEQ